MSSFRRFEDIDAWKKARELAKNIYREIKAPTFTDAWLKEQILQRLVTMTGDIAEGFEKGGAEFQHYLMVSKAACGEVRCLLYLALDQNYLQPDVVDRLLKQAEEAGRCIGGLAYYLKNNPGGYNARRRPTDGQNGGSRGYYQNSANRNYAARPHAPAPADADMDF